jgi:hypothetical protein
VKQTWTKLKRFETFVSYLKQQSRLFKWRCLSPIIPSSYYWEWPSWTSFFPIITNIMRITLMGILMMAITVRNALPHGRKTAESKKNLKGSRRQFTEADTTESYPIGCFVSQLLSLILPLPASSRSSSLK